jgi:hypothetical protein
MLYALICAGIVSPTQVNEVTDAIKGVMTKTNQVAAMPDGWKKSFTTIQVMWLASDLISKYEKALLNDYVQITRAQPVVVKPNPQHTAASGHLEAEDIRNTLGCKGPADMWGMRFMGEDRYFLICQIEAPNKPFDKRWAWQIITRCEDGWQEITAYMKGDGVLKNIVNYLIRSGATRITGELK